MGKIGKYDLAGIRKLLGRTLRVSKDWHHFELALCFLSAFLGWKLSAATPTQHACCCCHAFPSSWTLIFLEPETQNKTSFWKSSSSRCLITAMDKKLIQETQRISTSQFFKKKNWKMTSYVFWSILFSYWKYKVVFPNFIITCIYNVCKTT